MFDWNKIIESLENQRKLKKQSIDFVFASWPEQIKMLVEAIDEKQKKMESFNPATTSWIEQLSFMIEYLNIANEEREDIKDKLNKLIANGSYNSQDVDDLLDELIVALKKLKIM